MGTSLHALPVSRGGAVTPSGREGWEGRSSARGLTHAHFRIYALTSILRPRGRLPLRDDGGPWFSDPPGEKRWVIFLSCRASSAGFVVPAQAHDEMGQDFECLFSFLRPGTESPHLTYSAQAPFHVALVICLLVLRSTFLLSALPAEDRPLHIISEGFINWPE